jgi:hypothetical protein
LTQAPSTSILPPRPLEHTDHAHLPALLFNLRPVPHIATTFTKKGMSHDLLIKVRSSCSGAELEFANFKSIRVRGG